MNNSTIIHNWSNNTIMNCIRVTYKTLLFFSTILFSVLISICLRILSLPVPNLYYRLNTKYVIRLSAKLLLIIFGVKIKVKGKLLQTPTILVSNHWGYLDSLLLMSLSPCMLISTTDVKNMPVVGIIMGMMGFTFVDRENPRSIPTVIEKASEFAVNTNTNIAFFPEGGTNNGKQLESFHSSFFKLVNKTRYSLQPLFIQVKSINNEKCSSNNLETVVFHGHDESVITHIIKMFRNKSIRIVIEVLDSLNSDKIVKENLKRKYLCDYTEKHINDSFNYYHKGVK
jgi:1-acyl-sn-glycerol-3-phosphate acyltransferase